MCLFNFERSRTQFFYCYNIRTAICKHSIHFLHFSGRLCLTIRQKRSAPLFVSTRCLRCYLVTLPSHGGRLIFKECFFFLQCVYRTFSFCIRTGEKRTPGIIFFSRIYFIMSVLFVRVIRKVITCWCYTKLK